jgi:short subunit fatty acids transporter
MSGIIGIVGGGLGIAVAAMLASEKKWNTESSLGFAVPCGFTVMAIWEVGLGSKLLDTPVR